MNVPFHFLYGTEDNLIRYLEKETHTLLNVEEQIKRENREKKWKLER